MQQKKILITGASGFIGAHLTEKLVEMGFVPLLLLRKGSNLKRLSRFSNRVQIFESDLADFPKVKELVKKTKPQIIIHLAGFGVHLYTDNSIKIVDSMIETNVRGTYNLLLACKNIGIELFINTGSCFEYGSKKTPFTESSVLNPCNIYGATKTASTFIAQQFYKDLLLPVTTFRPFTVYGPGQESSRFISTVIHKCIQNQKIELTSESIVRDYIYIDDVVNAYLMVLEKKENVLGEIINISTGKGSKLLSVAQLIKKLSNRKNTQIAIGAFPKRPGEVHSLIGNPEKAKRLLKWEAKHSLEQGLRKTIQSVKTSLSNY